MISWKKHRLHTKFIKRILVHQTTRHYVNQTFVNFKIYLTAKLLKRSRLLKICLHPAFVNEKGLQTTNYSKGPARRYTRGDSGYTQRDSRYTHRDSWYTRGIRIASNAIQIFERLLSIRIYFFCGLFGWK